MTLSVNHMRPRDFIARNGIDYFTANKGKTITVRLLSDDGLVFSGYFVGITPVNNEVPLIDGLYVDLPQFNLHFMYTVPDDGRIIPVRVNLLMIDSMGDIVFS